MGAPFDLRPSRSLPVPSAPPVRTQGEPICVLFCCDPGYYQHLAVALVSLLENNQGRAFDIHLITSPADPPSLAKLTASVSRYGNFRLHVHDFSSRPAEGWHTSYHITAQAYVRLFAPAILAEHIGRIIYLDSDLVVVGDLSDLWTTDLEGAALAAVPDPFGAFRKSALRMPGDANYINSGVLLLDLARWREEGLSARVIAYVERENEKLLFHDQDAINAVLHAVTKPLSYRWNFQAKMLRRSGFARLPDRDAIAAARAAPAIIHYTSARKPWLFVMATPARGLYRRYLQMTAWRDTPPIGRRLYSLPEYAVNHLLFYLGIDYTWDRMLRATTPGRIIHRFLRLIGRR